MPIKITMPALSPTMEEGNLAKWNVKEGDQVNSGDVIAEIETDKATMEVEAVDEGIVAKIVVPAGTQGVKVNALIAILAEEGEDVASAANAGGVAVPMETGNVAASNAPDSNATAAHGATPVASNAPSPKGGRVFASPLARRLAAQAGIDLSSLSASNQAGRVVKADIEKAVQAGGGSIASPVAQQAAPTKIVAQAPTQQAAPASVPVSTPVSTPAPVLASVPTPQAAPVVAAPSDAQVLKLFKQEEYQLVAHDGMRKTIAKRLVESKQTVPHFYVTVDCQLDALLKMRSEINAAAPMIKTEKGEQPAYKLSVNDIVIKATAMALKAVPDANVSWLDSGMLRHQFVDVGVAVSIPNGLITPIIRHADEKSLSTISNEMKDLAKRARARKLKPEEYQGGSTAVSNMGMFGVKNFSAIINPPHATIFAIGAGEKRAIVKNNELAIATVMSVTLSTDHRAVDGALAAELAQVFKNLIEQPLAMLV